MAISNLWKEELKVVNLGNAGFYEDLTGINVPAINLEWKPAANGDTELIRALSKLNDRPEIDAANQEALKRINTSQPVIVGVGIARDLIPGMTENTLLHAGPPISWDRMSGPLKGAIIGALIFEKKAADPASAEKLISSGNIVFSPCHEHEAVGPMAGVVSPSMPVFIVENKTYKNRAYVTMNEGLGKVLRYGAYNEEVINRLNWMRDVLAPGLKKAIELSLESAGGIELKPLIAQALHMGDEVHNRNKAASSLLIRALLPFLVKAGLSEKDFYEIVTFINSNDHFFLNLSMAAAKSTLESANGIKNCSLAVLMARNGTDFGIKVSGLDGQWFTGPAGTIQGLLFPGFTEADKNPDIGDSAITETLGLGAFSMAASLAIVQFVGGEPEDAVNYSKKMYSITVGESSSFSIPILDFRGSPTGIDIRKVIETGILPQINTGIAHKEAGVGQVGAGLVNPPWECFKSALLSFAAKYAV